MPTTVPRFGRPALVARISLWFAAIASIGCATSVGLLALANLDGAGRGPLLVDRGQIELLIAFGGFAVAFAIAASTALIALHASFRVVGPLHRFYLALEEALRSGRIGEVRLRADDLVAREARLLEHSAATLYRHHDELAGALESAALAVRRGGGSGECPGERVHRLIERVRL